MRGRWAIWVSALLLVQIMGQFYCAKGHGKVDVHKQNNKKKETVTRFTIPHPNHPASAFIPEAIGQSVGTERGQIVGTELPGAYGEDYDMEGMESGSGVTSGSGSGSREKDSDSPEAPGKFGTNLVHNPPPSNPSAAFEAGNMGGEEEEEKEEVDLGKELDADGAQKDEKEEKKDDEPSPLPEEDTKTEKDTKKDGDKVEKKGEKHHKAEKSSKVSKKKTKAKARDHDENNMISKIDAIAKQIEKVEHREKLDRKEAATLKVAKKVAKKVIKNINAKKKVHKKSHKLEHKSSSNIVSQALSHALSHKDFDEFAEEEEKPSSHLFHKKEKSHAAKEPKGPEGFECPWACFWTCHSYCPKECCNNPFKCDLGCREFCTPYCTDQCCAPGSQRLPKLQINFNGDDAGKKNITAIFDEDDKHQMLANNVTALSSAPIQSPHEKEEEDAKLHTRLDPAENSYQQLKEQEHQIALANQIEALKKATSYAAQLMGLPPECPLACARICLPGLCKQQCCARSQVPNVPIVPPAAFHAPATNPLVGNFNPAMPIPSAERAPIVQGPQVNPARNQQLALANQFAMAQKQRYLMAHNPAALFGANSAAAIQQQKANAYMMNKLALQNRLLEGKNDFALPALARYRAMQYANQMNRQKLLLKNNLESQASRQQIADQQQQQQRAVSSSSANPSWLHNCPPICRSSCIPQCPNECCTHAVRGPAASMK